MRRVHREATERMGANRLGRNRRWKRGLAYRRMEETALCSTGHVQNGGPVDREGSGVPQNGENEIVLDLLQSKQGPVDQEGCGTPQNRRNGLVLERYG